MKKVDTRDAIMEHLKEDDRRLSWLASKSTKSYGHLYLTFVKKERPLSKELRTEINTILGTKF